MAWPLEGIACECGAPAKYARYDFGPLAGRCDACEVKHQRETFEAERVRWSDLVAALGGNERFKHTCPHVAEVQAWALERIRNYRRFETTEGGQGIAAKHGYVTTPGAIREPVTCDVGADWED